MPKPRSAPPEGFPGMMMNADDDDNSDFNVYNGDDNGEVNK